MHTFRGNFNLSHLIAYDFKIKFLSAGKLTEKQFKNNLKETYELNF